MFKSNLCCMSNPYSSTYILVWSIPPPPPSPPQASPNVPVWPIPHCSCSLMTLQLPITRHTHNSCHNSACSTVNCRGGPMDGTCLRWDPGGSHKISDGTWLLTGRWLYDSAHLVPRTSGVETATIVFSCRPGEEEWERSEIFVKSGAFSSFFSFYQSGLILISAINFFSIKVRG